MDINLAALPAVINSCFILHNFCEMNNETVSQKKLIETFRSDGEFQPGLQSGYNVNNNQTGGKSISICNRSGPSSQKGDHMNISTTCLKFSSGILAEVLILPLIYL